MGWLAVAVLACDRAGAPPLDLNTRVAEHDLPVARVGGAEIGQTALLAQMRATGKSRQEALQDLVHFELLGLAASQAIPASDPEMRHARDAALVQRLIERELEPHLGRGDIPDQVLREVYDRARKVFVHPRLVEVAMLSVYTGPRMKPEPRARAEATARALEQQLRGRGDGPLTLQGFEALAAEPAWKDRKVQFSRDWQGLDEPFPEEVGRAVQALGRAGAVTPLVTASTGYHLALYLDERPAETVSFEDAREKLRDQIFERWRAARFLEFVQQLAGGHAIEAYPERLP
jgi:PPIC-type PPIASE domain